MLTTDVCQGLVRLGQSWEKSVERERGTADVDGTIRRTLVVFGFGVPTLKGGRWR
jgi:hypothetical protein